MQAVCRDVTKLQETSSLFWCASYKLKSCPRVCGTVLNDCPLISLVIINSGKLIYVARIVCFLNKPCFCLVSLPYASYKMSSLIIPRAGGKQMTWTTKRASGSFSALIQFLKGKQINSAEYDDRSYPAWRINIPQCLRSSTPKKGKGWTREKP